MPAPTVLSFVRRPFQELDWKKEDLPVFVIDGQLFKRKPPTRPVQGNYTYALGASQRELEDLLCVSSPRTLHLRAFRGTSLAPAAGAKDLRQVILHACRKVEDLSALQTLAGLDTLVLYSVPKVRDLSFLRGCDSLRAVGLSGGMGRRARVATLAPLAELPRVREVALQALTSESDGLRPLARCRQLKRLSLPNLFETEEYAFLAAALPDLECKALASHTPLPFTLGGKDVMITGKGKPFLNSNKDAARIGRYQASFDALKARFASELARAGAKDA